MYLTLLVKQRWISVGFEMGYSKTIFLLREESVGIRKGKQTVLYYVRLQFLKLFQLQVVFAPMGCEP